MGLSDLLIVLLPLLTYFQVITGSRSLVVSDNLDYNVPIFGFVWRAWMDGDAPWWNPYAFSGYSAIGSGQGAMF